MQYKEDLSTSQKTYRALTHTRNRSLMYISVLPPSYYLPKKLKGSGENYSSS